MSPAVMKELMPRLMIVVLVWIGTVGAITVLDETNNSEWMGVLEETADNAAYAVEEWLNNKVDLAKELSEDPRVTTSFALVEGDDTQEVRKTLYEFRYLHETDEGIKDVYLFDKISEEIAHKTAGSPNLPETIIDALTLASNQERAFYATLFTSKGKTKLLVAAIVYDEEGEAVGYTAYIQPGGIAFKGFISLFSKKKEVDISLYNRQVDDNVAALESFNNGTPPLQIMSPGQLNIPVFSPEDASGPFIDPQQETFYAAYKIVPTFTTWTISSKIDKETFFGDNGTYATIIFAAAALLTLLILLFPLKGGYTDLLRKKLPGYTGSAGKKDYQIEKDVDYSNIYSDTTSVAEKALSKAKRKKTFVSKEYRPSNAVIAYNIRTGLKHKRIKLLYQPVMDLETNQPLMFDVFLHIIDELGEVMSPQLWLPVAQEENLFDAIDETVVTTGIETHIMKKPPLSIPLAFNVAGSTFESFSFMEALMDTSMKMPDIASHSVFKLHSREIIEDPRAMTFIRECREMGFNFVIDYFGGGPQTLKATKTLRFDFVKIDISRFDLKDRDQQKEFITLVKTAEAIELPIIIEKIENAKMLNLCKKLGIRYVQGWHIGKPESEDILKDY